MATSKLRHLALAVLVSLLGSTPAVIVPASAQAASPGPVVEPGAPHTAAPHRPIGTAVRPITPAAASAARVLILAGTVTGGSSSIEASEAAVDGMAVDVVDATTWSGMTAAQFASYRAIILGDPTCSGLGTSPDINAATANSKLWGPTINGNIVILGTDPVFHAGQGGETVTRRGVDFAVNQVGKTGAYITLSCYYHGTAPNTPVPLLDGVGAGGFTVTGVGCYNNAHIVAVSPALSGLTDADISNWRCSVHEAFETWTSGLIPLAIAKDFDSSFTASDGTQGPPYILAGGDIRSFPLSITPLNASAAAGGAHTVTAVLLDGATRNPRAGAKIGFQVTAGPNARATGICSPGSCVTGTTGQVSWTYPSNGSTGSDTIRAFYDINKNGTADVGEPQTTAGMQWTAPAGPIDGPISFFEVLGNGNICWTCVVNGVIQALFVFPVNTASGNFTASFRDIAIPGRGLPIDFNRTYNSLAANTDSPLGFGWTFSYGASLTEDSATGKVTIHQENASQVPFTPSGGGHYSAAPRFMATLVKNADGSFTFVRHQRETMAFSASGQLLKETDLNGNTSTLSYDGKARLAAVTDAAGRSVKLGYDATSHLSQLTDPLGRSVTFGYDGTGNLTTVEDVNGGHSRFTYDAQHRMLTMTDPKGGTVTNHYDAANRVDWQSDPLGRKTGFAYTGDNTSSTGGTTAVTDPKGNVTVEQYQFGERVAETKGFGTPQAATTTLTYDPATVGVTSVTDPNGHATLSTYDGHGNPLTVTDPLGRKTVNTYDTLDDVTAATDPKNVTTTAVYDARGNLLSQSRPLVGTGQSQVTTYHHDDPAHPGDVTSMTDADAQMWKYGHDTSGNLVSSTDPLGNKATSAFNVLGWLTSTVSPKGNVPGIDRDAYRTTIEYNRFGQATEVTDPLGHGTVRHYDQNGNLVESRDGDGNTTRYTYDAANEQTGTIRPDGTTLATDYNADGTVFHQYDGKHNATTYGYDPLARVTSVADPLGRRTTSTYDGAGNLQTVTDPLAQVATYSYDPANELASIAYSDGTTPGVSNLTYDADGQRLTMTDGTGTSTYHYDSLNRLTSSTDGAGDTVKYGYDLKDQLTTLTYPGGNVATRGFDPAGRLRTVTDWLSHTTTFGYDPNSNPTTEEYPVATHNVATSRYDAADRLMQITDAHGDDPFAMFTYKRDGANQLTSSSATGVDQSSQDYDYTKLNQLAAAEGEKKDSTRTVRYGYDPADNITRIASGSTLTYDAANQLQTATKGAGVTKFTYDQRGNRTLQTPSSGPAVAYKYDQVSQLTALGNAAYAYDGTGLRMTKTVAGAQTHFAWALTGGLPLLLQENTPAGRTNYVYGPDGLPLEQITGTTVSYYHHDQLGSTRVLTNSEGKVHATYTYDPYGNVLAATGKLTNPLRFAGEYQDAESGLYYLRARYYDPSTAQFLSRDPAVATTMSPYAYTSGNPLNTVDPTGLASCGDNIPWEWQCAAASWVIEHTGGKPGWQHAESVIDAHKGQIDLAITIGSLLPWGRILKGCEWLARLGKGGAAVEEGGAVLRFGSQAAARQGLTGDAGAAANRFFRDATSKSQDFQAQALGGGGYRLQFFSPANNPGYGKLYVQEIDSAGNVLREYKNTMGPNGLIETKWVRGGP